MPSIETLQRVAEISNGFPPAASRARVPSPTRATMTGEDLWQIAARWRRRRRRTPGCTFCCCSRSIATKIGRSCATTTTSGGGCWGIRCRAHRCRRTAPGCFGLRPYGYGADCNEEE